MSIFRQNFVLDGCHLNMTHYFIFAIQLIPGTVLELVICCIFAKVNFYIGFHIC